MLNGKDESGVLLRCIQSRPKALEHYEKDDLLRVHVAGTLIALVLYLLASWIQHVKI